MGIFIKIDENNKVTNFAGTVASEAMLAEGYFEAEAEMPQIDQEKQYLIYKDDIYTIALIDEFADTPEEELAKKVLISLTETVEEYIQSEIDKYNEENLLQYKDINSIFKYTSTPSYTHYDFCTKMISWNIAVWERARELQQDYLEGKIPMLTSDQVLEEIISFDDYNI